MRHKAAAGNNNQWEVWIALYLNTPPQTDGGCVMRVARA